jgi:hypothetical protein
MPGGLIRLSLAAFTWQPAIATRTSEFLRLGKGPCKRIGRPALGAALSSGVRSEMVGVARALGVTCRSYFPAKP